MLFNILTILDLQRPLKVIYFVIWECSWLQVTGYANKLVQTIGVHIFQITLESHVQDWKWIIPECFKGSKNVIEDPVPSVFLCCIFGVHAMSPFKEPGKLQQLQVAQSHISAFKE